MYKKIFAMLVTVALFGAAKVQAQWYIGIEGGANKNYLTSNTSDKPFFEYQPSNGFSVGVPVRYQFPSLNWFGGIQVVPTYIQKNYRIQRTEYYSPMYQQTTNNYVELPIMAQFRFGGNIAKTHSLYGILNLGGYGGYWMSGHVKGRAVSPMDPATYVPFDEAYAFSETKDNRFQWGGLAGVGLQYVANKNYVFSLEGRYTPAFSDLQKNYSVNQTPRYNDTYSILLNAQCQLSAIKFKKHNSTK